MSIWPDWIKVIQLKPRYLFGLCFLGSLILLVPVNFANTLGITIIRDSYRGWIGLLTLGSFTFGAVQLLPSIQIWKQERKRAAKIFESIHTLSKDENFLLAYCLDRNQRTICLKLVDSAGASLCQKGILERASGTGSMLAWPHTIPSFVWVHLLLHKEEILPEHMRLNSEVREAFANFDRALQYYK